MMLALGRRCENAHSAEYLILLSGFQAFFVRRPPPIIGQINLFWASGSMALKVIGARIRIF